MKKDTAANTNEGLIEVYKRIRPGDLAMADNARSLIHAMFFNFERYDLGRVGVYKFGTKFQLNLEDKEFDNKEQRVLSPEKLLLVLKEVVRLNVTQEEPDDIDHLGNRRSRAVGELVQNRFRVGMARMERIIKDRMSTFELEGLTPNKLINARPVIGTVREFFMSSQLFNSWIRSIHWLNWNINAVSALSALVDCRAIVLALRFAMCTPRITEEFVRLPYRRSEYWFGRPFIEFREIKLIWIFVDSISSDGKMANGKMRVTNEIVYLNSLKKKE